MPMGPWLDDRSLCAPRPFGRGRALPRGPEMARAPEPRLAAGLGPFGVSVPGADHDTDVLPDCDVNAHPTAERTRRVSVPRPAAVLRLAGVADSKRTVAVALTGFWRSRERLSGRPRTVEISHASGRCKGGRPCERRLRPRQPLRGDHQQDHRRAGGRAPTLGPAVGIFGRARAA